MSILVFEFMVGGGVADQHPLNDDTQTFFRQGHSMLNAVCEDLLKLGHRLIVPVDVKADHSLPSSVNLLKVECESDLDSVLSFAANDVQHILLIAPESDGCLEHIASLLAPCSKRFISPDLEFIRLTADKWKCHQWLSQRNVPCPATALITNENELRSLSDDFFPCVFKPIDGAGSEGVRLNESRNEMVELDLPLLAQRFVRGTAASVSVIWSKDQPHLLEPGRQVFDSQPFGTHVRTEFPLAGLLRERAKSLAWKTTLALPDTRGYFGIDMVLADDPADDVVIEINPRLTTSYAWLRGWDQANLAEMFPIYL